VTGEKSSVRIVGLVFGISLTIGVAQVRSQLLTGTPTEAASPGKHRTEKRTEATPPVESGASPSAAESPAASPTSRRIRKRTTAEVTPSPTPTPVASPTPRKFKLRFPRLFKPKTSPSASPSARIQHLQIDVGAAEGPTLRRSDVMRALDLRSKIGQKGFAKAMATFGRRLGGVT
jgi:hypothetical protein